MRGAMFSRVFFALVPIAFVVACGAVDDAFGGSADECCPRDEVQSGSMRLGGSAENGCFVTHDFFCSMNWRVEKDEHGCEVWRSDRRAPAANETEHCIPKPKVDAGVDAQ